MSLVSRIFTTAKQINSVAARRPLLRRYLQQAWDLAFMWGSFEPTEHHARHQAGKLEQPDLISVVSLGFSKLARQGTTSLGSSTSTRAEAEASGSFGRQKILSWF